MTRVGMHEAKTHLSKLVARAEAGEDVVIQRNGKSVARLVAVVEEPRSLASVRGVWRGRVRIADDLQRRRKIERGRRVDFVLFCLLADAWAAG
jgi:prevent-host-death family protein